MRPWARSFLRNVPRLMPRIRAARPWFPACLLHHRIEQGAFHLANHHAVQAIALISVQAGEQARDPPVDELTQCKLPGVPVPVAVADSPLRRAGMPIAPRTSFRHSLAPPATPGDPPPCRNGTGKNNSDKPPGNSYRENSENQVRALLRRGDATRSRPIRREGPAVPRGPDEAVERRTGGPASPTSRLADAVPRTPGAREKTALDEAR